MAIFEWDKNLNAKVFAKWEAENNKCTILVAINTHKMSDNNPNVKLVVYWDICLLFNLIIQQIDWVGRKDGILAFFLFTSKWTKIKEPKEIEHCGKNTGSSSAISTNT